MDINCACHLSLVLCAGRDGVTEATEVRLLSLAHQLKVQRLLAEVAFGWRVGLQLQAHLLPGMHQFLCGGKTTKSEHRESKILSPFYYLYSYRQSTSSSRGCGEVLQRYAGAPLPWLRWDNWWPERKCCAGSSWCHKPLCFSQHQTPG